MKSLVESVLLRRAEEQSDAAGREETTRPPAFTGNRHQALVRQLHAQGLGDKQIAAEVGLSHSGARHIRRALLGLPPNTGRP